MRYAIALFALFAACATFASNLPGLKTAENEIWRGSYGRTDTPPAVEVIPDDKLTCINEVNGLPGFNCPGSGCRQGCTFNPWLVQVTDVRPWSGSTLAHEYMHALKMRRRQIDTNHSGPEWKPGGAVDQANERLRSMGM